MTNPNYDPRKAHEYYLRTRHLKGRNPAGAKIVDSTLEKIGSVKVTKKPANRPERKASAQNRVIRLTEKLHTLQKALAEAETALREKKQKSRQTQQQEDKKNSDNKTTAKERAAAQKYRDTHKSKLATEAKRSAGSSGGGSSPKSVSEMSESELTDRISKIKNLISSAKQQIQAANSQAKSMSHSEFIRSSGPLAVTTK